MNWFGLFTMALCVVLVVAIFAHEFGYEKAEKDMQMSKQWVIRNQQSEGEWK